jgi:calcineurin-like phosphoesterase family protein
MNVWFTSDLHLGHKNIVGPAISNWKSGYRHFSSLEEMDATIIANINKVVKKNDLLINLGDLGFGSKTKLSIYLNQFNVEKIWHINGNHDSVIKRKKNFFLEHHFEVLEDMLVKNINGQEFHLFHYPIESWIHIRKGTIHLHGHCHGSLPDRGGKRMDVGIDTHPEFRPYHFDEIIEIMKDRPIFSVDHH